ncbi:MAG TPA: hypothetical protein VEL02_10230, partial [Jatrophihabitantaceae bacterium]|nr:hypothetical protein [Jatrophihabitantaceae bacterium]
LNQAVFAARRAIRLQQLLATIYDSLNKKLIRVAQVTLIEAVRLAPDDPAVRKAALDVDASQRPVQLDPAREQRLIAYRKAMRAGQDALDTRRYNDAINGFTTAGNIVRDDPDRSLFQAAEQGRKAAVEARRAAVRDLVAAGWTALDAKRPKDAKKAVDSAKQLAPADAEVRRLDQAVNDALRPPPTRYTLRISPATIELARKGQATAQVTVDRTSGYQGQITVELHKLPMGVTATPVTIPAGQTTGSITLRAASNARLGRATGAYAVGTRSSGTDVNSSTFTVNVK